MGSSSDEGLAWPCVMCVSSMDLKDNKERARRRLVGGLSFMWLIHISTAPPGSLICIANQGYTVLGGGGCVCGGGGESSFLKHPLWLVSQPLIFLSVFLFPVFGSTPSCPVLYLPCSRSDREIHTWRTLSVGYCMFTSRHQHIHSPPHCDSHLTSTSQPWPPSNR